MYCTVADVHSDEVCQMETFHAACESDRVILVESAQLGRLKIGIISCVLNIFSSSQSDLSDSWRRINKSCYYNVNESEDQNDRSDRNTTAPHN